MDSILPKLRGPFNFLASGLEEVRFHFPEIERSLPNPVPIFLGDGNSSPVFGYPIALSPGLSLLEAALRDYLLAEELLQLARLDAGKVAGFSLKEQQDAWARYRELLDQICHNVMTSNFGRSFPELFWLHQSLVVARVLEGTAGRVRKHNLELGRERGDALRYVVLFQFLDKVFALLFDLAGRIAGETNQLEDELFPRLLTRMRDNVLLFTQDHIGRDLQELTGYFRGYLKMDGRDLLYRYARMRHWHRGQFDADPRLQSAAKGWAAPGASDLQADQCLFQPGYIEHLTTLPSYRPKEFFSDKEAQLWSALVLRLKEFEFLHAARRLITPLEFEDGAYVCDARSAARLGAGDSPRRINTETRAYDFTAQWIINPEVARSGMIYDLRDFSSIVSILRLSERKKQREAFQQFLYFQHRVENIVRALHLHSEKYLGDGAFFSGRNSIRILSAALQIQRAYRDALGAGLPFDKGMRLALNFATYHLLPLGLTASSDQRHEVYGHGLVELTRMVSGKRGFDLAEVTNTLLARGYEDGHVNDFFRPILEAEGEPRDNQYTESPFRARLDADGTLINEGIVATHPFLQRVQFQYANGPLRVFTKSGSRFVGIRYHLEKEAERTAFQVGIRRLGLATFKGLDKVSVFEVIDGRDWNFDEGVLPASQQLLEAVEAEFTASLAHPLATRGNGN